MDESYGARLMRVQHRRRLEMSERVGDDGRSHTTAWGKRQVERYGNSTFRCTAVPRPPSARGSSVHACTRTRTNRGLNVF